MGGAKLPIFGAVAVPAGEISEVAPIYQVDITNLYFS